MSEKKTAKARKPFRNADGSIFEKEVAITTHTGRTRTETKFIARVRDTDLEGNRREKKDESVIQADAIIKRRQLRDGIAKARDPADNLTEKPKTFNDLADYYENEYVTEAVFVKNIQVSDCRENLG